MFWSRIGLIYSTQGLMNALGSLQLLWADTALALFSMEIISYSHYSQSMLSYFTKLYDSDKIIDAENYSESETAFFCCLICTYNVE